MADNNTKCSAGADIKGLLNLGCIVLQPWKIESSCRNQDKSWSYLVRWRDVWLHENICSKFSNLVDEYWIEQEGKPSNCKTTKTNATENASVDHSGDSQSFEVMEITDEKVSSPLVEQEEGPSDTHQQKEHTVGLNAHEQPEDEQEKLETADIVDDETNEHDDDGHDGIDENQQEQPQNLSEEEQQTKIISEILNEQEHQERPTLVRKNDKEKTPTAITFNETSKVLERALPQLARNIVASSFKTVSTIKKVKRPGMYKRTGPQKCEICDKMLSSKNSLREHRITVHLKNGRFLCESPGCEKRFSNSRALRIHSVMHTGERNFVCQKCGSTHKRARALRMHMSDMHKEGVTYRCDVCFKCLKEKADLKAHCFSDHKETVTDCIVCKQKLTTPFSIYSHCLKHAGMREFECDVCQRDFKTPKALNEHKKIHDPNRKPFRVCPKCGKALFSRSHYYEHVNSHDANTNEIVKFQCDICDTSFQHSSSLKRHALRHRPGGDLEHPKENPYLHMDESLLPSLCCRICRRNYTSKSGYYDHRKRCRDGIVTVFHCDLCDKKYSKRSALNRHIRLHHPDMLSQFLESIVPEVDAMGVEIEPTTVEVLDIGEANENGEQTCIVQYQVALDPTKDDEELEEGEDHSHE